MNQTTQNVYLALLNQKEKAISGEKIAEMLGLSRAAIWKSIQELKREGYQIESIKGHGYLLKTSDVINSEAIKGDFTKDNQIENIFVLEETTSTQEEAKHAFAQNLTNHSLFITKSQTIGRGRFNRAYYSEENKGIYMSLAIKPEITFQEMPQYTILTAVAVVEAIKKLTHIQTQIKWVNDIFLDGKKIAGILSEATANMETGQINQIIIGIGLNFSIQQTQFPKEIQNKATSLFADSTPTITKNQLIAEIWNQFFSLISTDFISKYKEYSLVLGRNVSFTKNGQEFFGQAIDITTTGELVVQLDSKDTMTLSSGEISLTKY